MKKLLAAVLSLLLAGAFVCAQAENAEKKLTVMVYMCGTDLETMTGAGTRCINEMVSSRFNTEAVNVVVLLGGAKHWKTGYDTKSLTLLELGGRRPKIAASFDAAAMSEPATLTSFLDYAHEHYPAERYDLMIWDHGGGPNWGVCQDQLYNSNLSMHDLTAALAGSSFGEGGLDTLIFHACLMSSAEVACMVSPYARYMVASEDSMYQMSFDWLKDAENDEDGAATGRRIVDLSYANNGETIAAQHEIQKNSFALIDLRQMGAVVAAMDTFFGGLAANLNDTTFVAMSGGRRDTCAFGVGESGSSSDYDLVDLGDLVGRYSGQDPDGAQAVLAAMNSAVIYCRTDNEGCTGMTVYLPYDNKGSMKNRMAVYNTLGFSAGYTDYVQRFAAELTGTPLADWTGLSAEKQPAEKAARLGFSLRLTEDQAAHYGNSSLVVLQERDNGSYTFVFETPETVLADGTLSGEYDGTALYLTGADGEPVGGPLLYSAGAEGVFSVPARGVWASAGDTADILLRGRAEDGEKLVIDSVLVKCESGYTTIYNATPADFSKITLISRSCAPLGPAENPGAFADWTVVSEETFDLDPAAGISLAFVHDRLDKSALAASFQVSDCQNYRYSSSLVPVNKKLSGGETVVSYDDLGLLTVTEARQSSLNGKLILSMKLTNLTDSEAVVEMQDITVNGEACAETFECLGNGANWGLEPGEESLLSAPFGTVNAEAGQELTIAMNLVLLDAADDTRTIGTVPVTLTVVTE